MIPFFCDGDGEIEMGPGDRCECPGCHKCGVDRSFDAATDVPDLPCEGWYDPPDPVSAPPPVRHIEIGPFEREPVALPVLVEQRRQGRQRLAQYIRDSGRFPTDSDLAMTCDDCNWAACCELAWDPYNTDGECLLSK